MYIAIISFILWGFFNFLMFQYLGQILPLNVILFLFLFAFILMLIYQIISTENIKLNKKDIYINIGAGVAQSSVYISYFMILFLFPLDAILIVVFYNFFSLLLVLFDGVLFRTKNKKIENILFIIIFLLSIILIFTSQMTLGKSIDSLSFNSLYGFIPAFFAAVMGILYKYTTLNSSFSSPKELIKLNFKLMYYRSLGGLIAIIIFYIILVYLELVPININFLEVELGILYAIFPFLLGHFLYSVSLYKKASVLLLSVFMNLSPLVTIVSIYYFSNIGYTLDKYTLSIIVLIFILGSFLTIHHENNKHIKED